MADHRVTLEASASFGRGALSVFCSCRTRPLATGLSRTSLARVNDLAHEHITAAEAVTEKALPSLAELAALEVTHRPGYPAT